MTAEQFSLLIEKLDYLLFLLNHIRALGLFAIGCAAAIIVCLILYAVFIKFIIRF